MITAIIALAAAPVTDWGPMMKAAQLYAERTHAAAGPYVRSTRSVETVVETAMRSCSQEERHMQSEARKAYEPLGLTEAELDAAAQEEAVKLRELMRTRLAEEVRKFR
jgi:hypothetical protein